MKIALINPCWDYPVTKKGSLYNRIWPPLDLLNAANLLEKNGFNPVLIDANADRLTPQEIVNKIADFDKIFINMSQLDRWQCPNINLQPVLAITKLLKNFYLIGAQPTVRPEEILELTNASAIIRNEPELTILHLCKENKLSRISGVSYKKDNKIVHNKDAEPINMDDLTPSYHLVDIKKYFYEVLGKNFAIFETARGCPYNCIYCLKKMYFGYRKKSSQKIIQELKDNITKYNIKSFYFIDLEFTMNRQLVEDICDFLIKNNYKVKWCCQTRADSVDFELLYKMKKAGCRLIHYGVETGSPRIMKLINKNITLEKIEQGINLTKKVGIQTACFFMFGLPSETREEMQQTIDFVKKLNPTYASFHIVIPYPGTKLHEMVKSNLNNLFPEAYIKEYSFNELNKIKTSALLQFYLRPSYILTRLFKGQFISLWRQFRLFLGYIKS